MKANSFGNLIWSSAIRSWGPVVAFIGLAIAFLAFFFAPTTDTVELRWLIVIVSIGFMLLVIFARAAWDANENQIVGLPKVIYVKDPPKAFPNAFALFLVEPTPLFSYDAIVSIYYLDDGVERLVGVGKVINVQNDLKVQVLVLDDYDFGGKSESIKNNSKDELKKLIVKSSVPGFLMEAITNV
ncbi:MAG: hypothetical protein ACPH3N_06045 [Alcanivorax sediminis]|uniref:hypothetical protein n=1 Tax=Alcanivorax sediminis TaxID=2663008 RepID=UPI003C3B127B